MKALVIILLIAIGVGLVVTPIMTNMQTERSLAAAERTYAEARLEQARSDTIQARADAFSQRVVVLLPWGMMIIGATFVAIILVLVIGQTMRPTLPRTSGIGDDIPHGTRIDTLAGPVYMIQFPTETRQQFMNRVASAQHTLDQRRLS